MKVHFIAMGGSIMHQLAIALHQKGDVVTGSDDEIYNPARANLEKHGLLPSREGWYVENITSDLDAIILGMHARIDNPELLKAQELGIPIYSYPAYIYEQSKDKKRVAIAGSHGKTTITAMVMHVLRYWKQDFDYLVGASLKGFDSSVKITKDAPIMIIEGDEYLSSPLHRHPKIHYYFPNIALMTGIAWDHINVFPTFENYVEQFHIFAAKMPENGVMVYNEEEELVVEVANKAKHLQTKSYKTPTFYVKDAQFVVEHEGTEYPLQIFGRHNVQNMEGARLICEELGINDQDFFEAVQSFKGAARRLELVAKGVHSSVYRDFAHAPSKVTATTHAMNQLNEDRELIACFELHTYSSLNKDFLPEYKGALNAAKHGVVFFNDHTFAIKKLPKLSKEEVAAAFGHPNLQIFTQKNELIAYLKGINYQHKDLLLMSSGTFDQLNLQEIANFVL
ncbi:MAG: UDP-N-acetylmuramate--L-alanine ligase [Chitinophagales bacterium]